MKMTKSSSTVGSIDWTVLPWRWIDGLGGTVEGSFFRSRTTTTTATTSARSNRILAGTTPIVQQVDGTVRSWMEYILREYITLKYFVYSPNLIWFLITWLQWHWYPYDCTVQTASSTSTSTSSSRMMEMFQERSRVNTITAGLYFALWHVGVEYKCQGAFGGIHPRCILQAKLWHNLLYWYAGILQWSWMETAIVVYGYQTGKLVRLYHNTATTAFLTTALWIVAVPLIRDFHFYFCHRTIHAKFLYKYVHAVHHRNADVDSWSGLCMHPIEHLYYYACLGPLLWMNHHAYFHPIVVSWMGMHCILAPAASHSGYEDHWGADLYHYLHHRYYECNYGASPLYFFVDASFGCFRASLEKDKQEQQQKPNEIQPLQQQQDDGLSSQDKNEAIDKGTSTVSRSQQGVVDPKSTLLPTKANAAWYDYLWPADEKVYWIVGVALPMAVLWNLLRLQQQQQQPIDGHATFPDWLTSRNLMMLMLMLNYRMQALVLASWPIVAAAFLHAMTYYQKRWPKLRHELQTTSAAATTTTTASATVQVVARDVWKFYMAPFHKDSIRAQVVHGSIGMVLCCILPVYSLLVLILEPVAVDVVVSSASV